MPGTCAGFVDVGYLRNTGSAKLQLAPTTNLNASVVVSWFRGLVESDLAGHTFLRAYWYDGAYDPSHQNYDNQHRLFSAIARTPGVQMRLGHIAERPNRLEPLMRRALEGTADDLGMPRQRLMEAFSQRWNFRPERQQKGVDTLIALDIVRLASRSAYQTAVLVTGDRDLAEAIRTAQDHGARIVIATPERQSVAGEIIELADDVIDIDVDSLRPMFQTNPRPRT